jgi:chemotaxis protein MotD
MTVVVTANPAALASAGAPPASAAPEGDAEAFSSLVSGMDPRRVAARGEGEERRPASTGEPDAAGSAKREDEGVRPAFGAPATRKPANALRPKTLRHDTVARDPDPSASGATPVPDEARAEPSVPEALLRALSTSEQKTSAEREAEGETAADGRKPEAPSGPVAGAAITLRLLLGEHRIAASEAGRADRSAAAARPAAGPVRGATTGADDTSVATATDAGPDPFAGLIPDAVPEDLPDRIGIAAPSLAGARHAAIEVLDQATWLPPAITQDNLRQITDAVLTAAKDPAGAPDRSASPVAAALSSDLQSGLKSHDVVKTLTIRLQPDDLGTLTAHLRLSGETMTLHITASRAETARMLMADKDELASVLKEAGLNGGRVVVTVADPLLAGTGNAGSGTGPQGQFGGQQSGQSAGQPAGQSFAGGQGGASGGNHRPDDRAPYDRGAAGGNDPIPGPDSRSPDTADRRAVRRGELYL